MSDELQFHIMAWIQVISRDHSLDQLDEMIGVSRDPEMTCHEKGSYRRKNETWDASYWRYEADYQDDSAISSMLNAIIVQAPPELWSGLRSLPAGLHKSVVLGVFLGEHGYYDLRIPSEQLQFFGAQELPIDMTVYR